MCSKRSCQSMLAAVAVALLAVSAVALRDDQLSAGPSSSPDKLGRRRLLQPFDLGIPAATRRSGNTGNTGERRTNANAFAIANNVDTGRRVNNTIRARTNSVGEATNLDFGGVTKTTYTADSATTNRTAATQTGVSVRSIALPGPGITASRAIDSSSSLAAKRLKPAEPPRNVSTLERFQGPTDDTKAGSWEVLGAGAADYAFAGDYDYSLIRSIVSKRAFVGYRGVYDYDYGQPRPIPETAAVDTRTRSNLNNPAGRAAGYGRIGTTTTAPNAVSRGVVIASGLHGVNAARFNDDIFGNAPVFVPPNQFRQSGASAANAALAKTYKGSLRPGVATNTAQAGSTVSRNYLTGNAADQVNYAAGTQAVSVRSQNVALSGEENIDFDVGRRRLQAAKHHNRRRRLHTTHSGVNKKQQ